MNIAAELTWTPEADDAFVDLKGELQSAPALGIPDPSRPFTQVVDERDRYMASVLLQEHGGQQYPVAYFSSRLIMLSLRASRAAFEQWQPPRKC